MQTKKDIYLKATFEVLSVMSFSSNERSFHITSVPS